MDGDMDKTVGIVKLLEFACEYHMLIMGIFYCVFTGI